MLLTSRAWAQSEANCDQIRQAVATYGYEEARRHALIHYGAEAVERGERKCLPPQITRKPVAAKPVAAKHTAAKPAAKHQAAKKPKTTASADRPVPPLPIPPRGRVTAP